MQLLTRRLLLGSLALPGNAAPTILAGCQTNAWRIDPADPAGLVAVLAKIKDLGYQGFETTFRNLEKQPAEFAKQMRATGLRFLGIHIWMPEYGPEGVPGTDLVGRVIQLGAAFGAERLIVSGAPPSAGLERKAAALNDAAGRAKSAGLGFAYHNHAPEFTGAPREIDEILRRSGADLILDAGHAYLAGADVAAFFERHHRRIAGIHLRDFRQREQVPLGDGQVDYRPLANAAKRLGWSGWVINEEERLDNVKPGESAVGPARKSLARLFGV